MGRDVETRAGARVGGRAAAAPAGSGSPASGVDADRDAQPAHNAATADVSRGAQPAHTAAAADVDASRGAQPAHSAAADVDATPDGQQAHNAAAADIDASRGAQPAHNAAAAPTTQDRTGGPTADDAPPHQPVHQDPPNPDRSGTDAGPPPDGPPDEPDPGDGSGDGEEPGDWGGEARWVRPFLVVAAAVGLLLLGAAAGLLIGLPGADRPTVPGPDSVDVGFAQDMSVHHQQAVEMAGWERDHSTDPVLIQLATDMETTQNSQVGRMQGWLDLWGAAPLPVGGHMAWMSDPTHGSTHGGGTGTPVPTMPGMASAADLAALRAATGRDLDVLFLQLMLRHHEGGKAMLEYGAQHAAVPQLRNLAAQMLSSQTAESDYLRQLLAQRGAQPLPS